MTLLKTAEIEAFVARPDPARPIVLVVGADAGLVSERAEAVVRASLDDPYDPFALLRIAGDELASDPARLVDEAQAIPMFGGRRAIWVRAGTRSFVPAVETLIASGARECRVVIEAGDLRRNAPLRVVCERERSVAVIPCYADGERDIARLIDEEMRSAGLTIAPEVRAALVPLLGGDRRASRNELRKLALFAHGRGSVTLHDVMVVVADASALAIDAVVDATFAGRPKELDAQLTKAVAAGTTPSAIIFAAQRQIATLHRARLNIETGSDAGREVEGMRLHFSRKAATETALKTWTASQLARAMQDFAQAHLETRVKPALADIITHRALMVLAMQARRRE
jgi:DNA polymerase-3 subunit delta